MKFLVSLERDEDGIWVAECPSIPGCVSQGETKDEALVNVGDAIRACLEVRAERGMPLTIENRQIEVLAGVRPARFLQTGNHTSPTSPAE